MALRYDEQALNGDAGDDRAEEPDRDEDDREAEMTLCFGDQIFLYDMENKGFVFNAASGTVHAAAFVQRGGKRSDPQLGNIKSGVFEIHAPNKFKAARQLDQDFDKLRKTSDDHTLTLESAMLNPTKELAASAKLSKAEEEDNHLEQRRRFGAAVVYGQMVQLWHVQSQRYMRISSTVTSEAEANNMRVEFDDKTSRQSWFRIMPRYKVRSESDNIRMNDQIVLESVKTVGQFLHTTKVALRDEAVLPGRLEVNISVTPSSYSVLPHILRPPSPFGSAETATKFLRGGDIIQLFHKEISAYLAAEGSFYEEEPRENVHMRVREPDSRRPHRLLPPTSAVSFWQVELDDAPTSGAVVLWEMPVRFRHVTTQLYLTLDRDDPSGFPGAGNEAYIGLTKDPTDANSVFSMTAVIKERPEVVKGSYTRILQSATGYWLHAAKSDVHERRWALPVAHPTLNNSLMERMSAIEWDKATLRRVSCTRQRMFDDAFTITEVPAESVQHASYFAGVVPVLQQFVRVQQQRDMKPLELLRVTRSLQDFTDYLKPGGEYDRKRQKMVRNFGLFELMASMLQAPFRPFNTNEHAINVRDLAIARQGGKTHLIAALERIYGFLAFTLKGNSRKNELYAARHIPFFQTQLGCNLGMERMYTELVMDNNDVVEKIEDEEIQKMVDLLRQNKNPDYLDFFSVLCSVERAAIGENQAKLVKLLMGDNDGLVYHMRLDTDRREVVVNTTGDPNHWVSLRTFSAQAHSPNPPREYTFLERQLHLFGELCLQRCDDAIKCITQVKQYLTWDVCFFAAQDSQLPYRLRTMFVHLMTNLFVDVDPNVDVLAEVKLAYVWDKLTADPFAAADADKAVAISGARMPFFEPLSDWLAEFLQSHTTLGANEPEQNELITAVLDLLCNLVTFGYYSSPDDVIQLMRPLIELLSGFTDVPTLLPMKKGVKFETRSRTLLGRRQTNKVPVGEQEEVKEWRETQRYVDDVNNSAIVDVKLAALRVVDVVVNLTLTVRVQQFLFDYKQMSEWNGDRRMTRQTRSATPLQPGELGSGPTLTPEQMSALQAIARASGNDADIIKYTTIMREYLTDLLDRGNYINPKWRPETSSKRTGEAPDVTDLVEILLDLARYEHGDLCCRSLQILNRLYSASHDLLDSAVKAQVLIVPESIKLAAYLEKNMPVLRRLSGGQIEEGEEEAEFVDIVEHLKRKCILDEQHSHTANQHIVVANGIVPVLFDVLDHEDQPCKTISACFNLLEALIKDNDAVQEQYYSRLDRLLTIETDATGWENDMARATTAVFADNQVLSLKLTPAQIELMMGYVRKQTVHVPDLLITLASIAKCEELGVPLPRNQNLIMKMLMKSFDDVVAVAHVHVRSSPETNRQRLALLRGAHGAADDQLRRYHACLVDLLATCAEGMNRYIESTCMTLFDLHEILEVLLDQEIPSYVKTAYMRFLNYVYLETEGEPEEMGTTELYCDQRLWQAIRGMGQQELPRLFTDNAVYLKPDDELFVFEGYFPFVTDVLNMVFKGDQYPESVRVIQNVGQLVAQFVQRALNRVYDKEHIKVMCALMAQLEQARKGTIPGDLLARAGERLRAHGAGVTKPPVLREYDATYKSQHELNDKLNEYAQGVRKGYCGKNDVGTQLADARASPENAEKQYCENEDEDEPLPLGPEFQAFLGLFVVYDYSQAPRRTQRIIVDDAKSLVKSLDRSRKYLATMVAGDQARQQRLDIRCQQLLRAVLHNELKLGFELEDVTPLQDQMCHIGAVLPVASMLSVENDDVVREALALLVAMLGGGNKLIQASFMHHFLHTREESFFDDIQRRMRRSMESKRELRNLSAQVEAERVQHANVMGTLTLAGSLGTVLRDELADGETAAGVPLQLMGKDAAASDASDSDGQPTELGIGDEGNIELVLRVLQYMCEGHNLAVQDYLRKQPDNIRSIDLVGTTVEFLSTLMDDIDSDNIELVIQTMETLVEFAQGCPDNQVAIFDAKVVDSINHILRHPSLEAQCDCDGKVENVEKVAHLKLACATLVLAMLENSGAKTKEKATELEETLDLRAVISTMHHYDQTDDRDWKTDLDNDDDPVEAADVAYAHFNVLIRLKDFTGNDYGRDPKFNSFAEEAGVSVDPVYEKLAATAVSIEILRDNELHKVHFQDKWAKKIRKDVKEQLNWSVDRSSPTDKATDFLDRVKVIMADIEYFDQVMDASPVTHAMLSHTVLWGQGLLFLTLLINILMLAVWQAPISFDVVAPDYNVDWYESVLYVLGALHIFFSVLVTASHFLLRPPSIQPLVEGLPYGLGKTVFSALPWLQDESGGTKTSPLSVTSLHHMFLVVFSVLGVFFHGYFYCYHLLHVIVGNDLLLRVLSSVTKNGKSLLWVAALMVIVIYIYSLASFAYLRKSFDESEGAYCQTAFQCFVTSLRLGLLSGGGLGEALPPENFSFTEPGVRTLFDLSYFIIITIIGLNVVFGIIVDTFSELRDERFQIAEAMKGECFICSIKAYDFDRHSTGFKDHVAKEHNMWNYVSFFLHLKEKEATEYNSHEQYVWELFEQDSTDFFPLNRAMALSASEDDAVEARLDSIDQKVTELLMRMDHEEKLREEEARRRARVALQQPQ